MTAHVTAHVTVSGRRLLAACSLAIAIAASIAGCAGEPTRIPAGTTRADTLQRLGAPTGIYPLADGGERLQYSRGPAGYEVNDVDLDASGRVVSVRQVLQDGEFARDLDPAVGRWREGDVLRTYGRPYDVTRVTSHDGVIWSWRYKAQNRPRFLYVYIDRQGLVSRWHTGDDLSLDRLPW